MADRLELMEVDGYYPTPEQVEAELPKFVARYQQMVERYYDTSGMANQTPEIYMAGGRKYIKIARRDPQDHSHGTSVCCFVRAVDGAILKAATWKAPALNFTRGNIFDKTLSVGPHGVRY